MRGKFIVFEGIDGVGKTTLSLATVGVLAADKNNSILYTREPTPRHQEIRRSLETKLLSPTEYLRLFTEDRREHLDQQIIPTLEGGAHVVCDRYLLSTMAYQSAQGIPLEKVWETQQNFPLPDITFFLDCPFSVISQRRKEPGDLIDRDTRFQQCVILHYYQAISFLREKGAKIVVVDSSPPIEQITQSILAQLNQL